MELELGLKITRTREDVSSSVDFRFSKDPFGPLVLSRETNSRFIIIIHLKGFKKEGIEIDINKEGNRITIEGRKPVEEMVMIRWMAWKKEVEFRVFKKVFRIPDTVDLDEIKARFDDDDATLTITMPKRVKGISGFNIEEEEEEKVDFGDVSAAGEVEEETEKGEAEEQNLQRGESDVQSKKLEKALQKEEEIGQTMENKERENQVLEAEENSFSAGGVEDEEFGDKESQQNGEEETEDDYLEKSPQIDEQDNIMECIQEEQELADSNKGSEDSSLRKPTDLEGRESLEQTRHDEQEYSQHSETVIQREEEFGEREKDIKETDGYNLDNIHQSDEEDKIHQIDEQDKETIVADSNKENEAMSLRKPSDIQERDSQEQTGHEEQELDSHEQRRHEEQQELDSQQTRDKEQERVVEEQDSQAETNINDFGCRAFEEIGEQKLDVIKSREMEKETIDDDVVVLSKVQEIEQPEIHNDASKKVEGETSGYEREKFVKMGVKDGDSKEEVDGKMGEGFRPNIDRTQVVAEKNIGETETKAEELESDKLKADEVDKTHELVKKKEEEGGNAKVRRQSEDRNLIKLQENEEQHYKGQRGKDKQKMIKGLVEETTPKAEADTGSEIPKPVYSKTGDKEKEEKKSVKMEIKTEEAKKEVNANVGGGFAPNIAETETNFEELESDKLDSDKIQKMDEKKEEEKENTKVGTHSEDSSLTKLKEIGEQHIKGQKLHEKQEQIRDLVEEQNLEGETSTGNDIPKPVQEIEEVQEVETLGKTGDEGKVRKENKNSVMMDINNEDVKEEVDEMGQRFKPNVSETDTKSVEFESDQVEADEVDKIHALVEKKEDVEENAEIGRETEDISLEELQETEEQKFHRQKRHDKLEKINEIVEEKTLEVAERSEGKHKIQRKLQEDTMNQPEEYKEKITVTRKKTNDSGARKVQEIIRQQELDEPGRSEKDIKIRELVKSKKNDEEKEEKIAETEIKEQESYRPKILRERGKIQELAEEKTNFSKTGKVKEEEDIAEKKTEFGDDGNISGKVEKRVSDAMKGQEEKDMIQALAVEEKVSDGGKRIIAVSETNAANEKSKKVQEIDEQQLPGKQFQKLIGGEVSSHGEVEDVENEKKTTEAEKIIRDRTRESQEIEKTDSDMSGKYIKGTKIQETEETVRGIYRNEHGEEKNGDRPENITGKMEHESLNLKSQLEQDNLKVGEETQELVEEKFKDCREDESSEESKTKADDDVVRNVHGIKEQDSYGLKREHERKIQELVEEKTGDHEKEEDKKMAESEIEADCDSLRKVDGSKSRELHEPKIQKERDKAHITATEEPSCQIVEKIMESMKTGGGENCGEKQVLHETKLHKECDKTRITEVEEPNGEEKEKIVVPMIRESVDVPEIDKEQPDKLESQEKPYKIQKVVEAGLSDHKEEKVTAKAELEIERESSKKVEETEQQKYDGPKMQITEEKKKTIAVEENEIVDRRTTTEDCSLTKVRDDEDQESSKTYKSQKEDKTHELVEMGTSDYRGKAKKQDENDILRSQEDLDEFERHGEQSKVPQLVEEEKVENITELGGEMEEASSGNFHEYEEEKSYEDLVKEEETYLKDKHTGGEDYDDCKKEQNQEKTIVKAEVKTEEDSSKRVQDTEKQGYDELQISMVQEKIQETEEKDKTRVMEENELVKRRKKTKNESLRKVREGEEDQQLGKQKRHGEKDRIQELVETELNDHRGKVKKKDGDDVLKSQETVKLDLGERERHFEHRKIHKLVEDEHTGIGEEERYQKVSQAKTKVEDEIDKTVGENKEPEPEKQERDDTLDKSEGVLKEEASDREKDDFTTKIQETEREELHQLEMQEKQDMVPDFVDDETENQKDEEAEEAADAVASNANRSSRMGQTIEEESEKHKEQNKIPETSDHKLKETKEEVPESRNVRETKELAAHFQELEGKTKNCNDDDGEGRRGEKGKQEKMAENFESKSDDGIVRMNQETKVQESNEKKNQEQKGKIEEPERKKCSIHEVKLVTEDDSLRKGQEILEKGSNVSKRGPVKQEKIQQLKKVETQDLVTEGEEQAEVNEKIAEEWKQDKTDSTINNPEEPYEIQESSNIQESVEKETQNHRGEEMNERGGYNAVLKKKSKSSSESQDVEEQGSDQPKSYAEQELMTEEERQEEYSIREGEQKEKAKRMSQVDSIANDNSSKKNHQELVEIETIDQRKEELEEENDAGKAETTDEYDSSRKIHGHVERNSDKLERYGEEEMSKKLAEQETSDDKEAKKGIRAGGVWEKVDTKIRADGFGKVREIEEQEKDKKHSYVKKGIRGKSKENKNHETKRRDDSSGNKIQENEKQEPHEQKRTEEEKIEENEHDSSRKSHEHDERKSEKMRENIADEETNDDKDAKGIRAGAVLGEIEKHEQDKKKSFVNTSGKAEENKNQETKRRDDSAGSKTQKQESHKKNGHDKQEKNLGLVGEKTNCCRNEDDVKEDKEIADAEVPRKLKGTEKRESTKKVERHENRDDITELVEDKLNNKEGKDNMRILAKAEDAEPKGPEELRKQEKSREQRLRDNLKYEETAKTETERKDNESRKIHQVKEEETDEKERFKDQGRIKELVEDSTHTCREEENRETEFEDGCSKKTQERDKEEPIEPRRNEKGEKIQEPVDKETSEDDHEEELEIEFEDEEEDWEAEVIQETDEDEDEESDKIRQIKRIRLGFRLVGGSTLFMSLIVIVISFIRSKRKIKCYNF
ncbi:hypothetical protein CARUB_v10019644mg [Capsella rubella]|uniref:SHSP domain-containing protein n=1 Tax=Capsella rubella TaxID=81985 RepID=R0GD68_9BRAS|nr:hypothetical protein CARUB_v10019644mg [Capsella rubella]